MGTRLLMYLAVIMLGALVGARASLGDQWKKRLGSIQTACLLLLLGVMGIKIGMDQGVIDSFLQIGYRAIVMSIFTISFSISAVLMGKSLVTGGAAK